MRIETLLLTPAAFLRGIPLECKLHLFQREIEQMRALCGTLVWALLSATSGSEEPGCFLEEEEIEELESSLADRPSSQRLALRWRLQGASPKLRRTRIYQRLEWRWGLGCEVYLITERDPGEPGWADFAAFYLQWKSVLRPLELVAGNLRPGFGQGIVFSRAQDRGGIPSLSMGGDSERLGHRSSAENPVLRGVAVRYRRMGFAGVVLGGQMLLDARVGEDGRVTSLPVSGLHVTEREREGRALLRGRLLGVRLRYLAEWLQAGLVMQNMSFGRALDLRRPERTPWAFRGKVQRLWALDAQIAAGPGRGFVEVALDRRGNWGLLGGVRLGLNQVRLSALLRHYAPGFHSFYGGAASSVGMRNEQGFQLTLVGRRSIWQWRLYLDQYRRPQPVYFSPLPQVSEVWGLELGRRLRLDWRLRAVYQQRLRPSSQERGRRARIELEQGTRLRLRLEGRWWKDREEEWGSMASLRWKDKWESWSCVFHFSRFRTPSYGTRIYEFEYDLPGAVSIRPLYGSGWRFYSLVGVKWGGFQFSGRYRLQRDPEVRHYAGLQFDVKL